MVGVECNVGTGGREEGRGMVSVGGPLGFCLAGGGREPLVQKENKGQMLGFSGRGGGTGRLA